MKKFLIPLMAVVLLTAACSVMAGEPTPRVVEVTRVVPQTVVVPATAPAPAPATSTSMPAPTAIPPTARPVPTSTPAPTSAPVGSIPNGWLLVESKDTGGKELSFNHDNDGSLKMVFLSWDLIKRTLRVTWDPAGEKILGLNGGWGKYQWQGGSNPTKDQVTALVNWRVAQLGGGYTVSWQQVTTAPYEPKHAAQPSDWTESRQPKFTGDQVLTVDVSLDNEVGISWFHAREAGKDSAGSCTMFVMSKSGSTTYQGGLRVWKLVSGGIFTKDQFKVLVNYWKDVLQRENRGTCPVYTVIFQDPSMAF